MKTLIVSSVMMILACSNALAGEPNINIVQKLPDDTYLGYALDKDGNRLPAYYKTTPQVNNDRFDEEVTIVIYNPDFSINKEISVSGLTSQIGDWRYGQQPGPEDYIAGWDSTGSPCASQRLFNADDKWEFVVNSEYEDNYDSARKQHVVNEDGEILYTIDKYGDYGLKTFYYDSKSQCAYFIGNDYIFTFNDRKNSDISNIPEAMQTPDAPEYVKMGSDYVIHFGNGMNQNVETVVTNLNGAVLFSRKTVADEGEITVPASVFSAGGIFTYQAVSGQKVLAKGKIFVR